MAFYYNNQYDSPLFNNLGNAIFNDLTLKGPIITYGQMGTSGQVLIAMGGNVAPRWETLSTAGIGTVTSVGLTVPSGFSVSGSPITGAGTLAITGSLNSSAGGTGISSYAIGDILYASGATTLSKLADIATGNALISGGVTTAPSWGKIGLTTHVSGTLPIANGGTNLTSLGSALQVLRVNAGGTALEYAVLTDTGITTLNTLTALTQTFATGTSGTDFAISSATSTHTFNLPTASASNRGALSSTDWTTFNNKLTLPSLTSGSVLFSNGTTIAQDNANFFWDDTNNYLGINTAVPASELHVVSVSTSNPRGVIQDQYSADALGARYNLRKARGTFASPTVITTADVLGRVTGWGYDGSAWNESARISMTSEGSITSSRVPSFISFSTSTDASPSVLTEYMRITSAGRVGIGTTSPSGKLHLVSTTEQFRIGYDISNAHTFTQSPSNGLTIAPLVNNIKTINITDASGTSILNLDSTNVRVGVGQTTPTSKLEVQTNSLGVTQTTTSGLALTNSTAASLGAQQISPAVRWSGLGWGTTASTSQTVEFRADVLPVQSTIPTGTWQLAASINGGAYGNLITVVSGGIMALVGGIQQLNFSDQNVTISRSSSNLLLYGRGQSTTGNTVRLTQAGASTITSGATGIVGIDGSFTAGAGSATFRSLEITYTLNNSGAQSGIATGIFLNATETALNSMIHNLMDLQVASSSLFKVSNAGAVTGGTYTTSGSVIVGASQVLSFSGRSRLWSDADGSLRLTNAAGTNFTNLQFGGTTNSFNTISRDAVNGFTLQSAAATATWNDASTAASGTVANRYLFGIAAPTLTATNATVTDTIASTVYIGGAPTASTNTTIGTAYALNVAAGNTLLGGNVTVSGTLKIGTTGSYSGVGTATTVFTVTIGQTMTNAAYNTQITPTAALSAALFYVTNKTTTTFDVTYLAGLTGTVTFDWVVLAQ